MKGTIGLRNLEVECRIGVPPEERANAQTLSLDVELDTDIAAAVSSDAVEDTLDYNAIAGVIREVAVRRKYRLVEALAEEITRALLQEFPAVTRLLLEVRKTSVAIDAAACFVRIERDG